MPPDHNLPNPNKHVYPPWHKYTQRILFALAILLCILFPILYETSETFSSLALTLILVLYFVFWVSFSLYVRFRIPSYSVESALPTYTHSPPVRYSPHLKAAKPVASAIRVRRTSISNSQGLPVSGDRGHEDSGADQKGANSEYNSLSTGADVKANTHRRRARFGDDEIDPEEEDVNNDHEGRAVGGGAAATGGGVGWAMIPEQHHQLNNTIHLSPSSPSTTSAPPTKSHTVTFKTRARGNTTDSTNSETYPTFADYRQGQLANLDAFAQRIKRAFNTAAANAAAAKAASLAAANTPEVQITADDSSNSLETLGSAQVKEGAAATTENSLPVPNTSNKPSGRARSSSTTSMSSMMGEFAEKIKLSTLFSRTAGTSSRARSSSDVSAKESPALDLEAARGGMLSSIPSSMSGSSATPLGLGLELGSPNVNSNNGSSYNGEQRRGSFAQMTMQSRKGLWNMRRSLSSGSTGAGDPIAKASTIASPESSSANATSISFDLPTTEPEFGTGTNDSNNSSINTNINGYRHQRSISSTDANHHPSSMDSSASSSTASSSSGTWRPAFLRTISGSAVPRESSPLAKATTPFVQHDDRHSRLSHDTDESDDEHLRDQPQQLQEPLQTTSTVQ